MGWDGPILTDSGGFQVFSLAQNTKITEEQAVVSLAHRRQRCSSCRPSGPSRFRRRSAATWRWCSTTSSRCPTSRRCVRDATERTRPLGRSAAQAAQTRDDQALFAIVQGGLDPELRVDCAARLAALDFPGYAVGGLSVGETPAEMYRVLDVTVPALPADRPRYLMGVGRPHDLLEAIRRGIDLFDCVLPTRNGRNALAFTDAGPLRLRNLQYRARHRARWKRAAPARPAATAAATCGTCSWPTRCSGRCCVSLHNLTYYQRLLADARQAIGQQRFAAFADAKLRGWAAPGH